MLVPVAMQDGFVTNRTAARSNVRRASSTRSVPFEPALVEPSVMAITAPTGINQLVFEDREDIDDWEVAVWLNVETPASGTGIDLYDHAPRVPFTAGDPVSDLPVPYHYSPDEGLEETSVDWADTVARLLAGSVGSRPDGNSPGTGIGFRGSIFPEQHARKPPSGPFVRYTNYSFVDLHVAPESSTGLDSYMEAMHCFELPEPTILDEFVRQYFLHVHPNLPLLDEGEFMETYRRGTSAGVQNQGGISLFVLQGMLYATSTVRATDELHTCMGGELLIPFSSCPLRI